MVNDNYCEKCGAMLIVREGGAPAECGNMGGIHYDAEDGRKYRAKLMWKACPNGKRHPHTIRWLGVYREYLDVIKGGC